MAREACNTSAPGQMNPTHVLVNIFQFSGPCHSTLNSSCKLDPGYIQLTRSDSMRGKRFTFTKCMDIEYRFSYFWSSPSTSSPRHIVVWEILFKSHSARG